MIRGKNINLRLVEEIDAEFIIDMRTNSKKIQFLSLVDPDVEKQKEWIQEYKKRENQKKEFYFIIESKYNERLGLVRVYDLKENSFCWGSWLIKDDAPNTTAIESALQVYEFAFYILKFEESHFDVRQENEKVNAFHQRFGAKIVNQDDQNYFYKYTKKTYEQIKQKYQRYLS